jgi:hypothetical protein
MRQETLKPKVATAVVIVSLAIAAFLIGRSPPTTGSNLTNGIPRSQCVSGSLARNPRQDRLVMPESRTFGTLEEAQAYVCFGVPFPRETGIWRLTAVRAQRSNDLDTLLSDNLRRGHRTVNLGYEDGRPGTLLNIEVFLGGAPQVEGAGTEEQIVIQGAPATIGRGGPFPAFISVVWEKDGLGFLATGSLSEAFTREELLLILESIR